MPQGNQIISVDYYAFASSDVVNRIGVESRPVGVYEGGYLTSNGVNSINVEPFICEIKDASGTPRQIRIQTQDSITLTLDPYVSGINHIVVRWDYIGNTGDYAVISVIRPNAYVPSMLILGTVLFDPSGNFLSINYLNRTFPSNFNYYLNVRQTLPNATLSVWVKAGRLSRYNNRFIPDTKLTFVPPVSSGGNTQYRTDLVYIDLSTFLPTILTGTPSTDPSVAIAPAYQGIPLAEISLYTGQTSIIQQLHIVDARPWFGAGGNNNITIVNNNVVGGGNPGVNFLTTPYNFLSFDFPKSTGPIGWTTLDVSPYVPQGANAIILQGYLGIVVPDTLSDLNTFMLRKSVNESTTYDFMINTNVESNTGIDPNFKPRKREQGIFPITSGRTLDYTLFNPGGGFISSHLSVSVVGYFI